MADVNGMPVSRLVKYTPQVSPRLIVSTEGFSGCGKTRFALSAPGPTAYLSLDRGFDDATGSLDLSRTDVGEYSLDAILSREDKAIADEALVIWDDFCRDWRRALEQGRIAGRGKFEPYRTAVMDTGTEVYQLLRLARYGRVAKIPPIAYPDLYSEFRAKILKPAYRSNCNVIVTHKLKAERKNTVGKNARGEPIEVSVPTGRFILDGYPEFRGGENSYAAPTTLLHTRDLTQAIPERYVIKVLKCAPQPELDGMELAGLDFPTFAQMVYPSSDVEYWT